MRSWRSNARAGVTANTLAGNEQRERHSAEKSLELYSEVASSIRSSARFSGESATHVCFSPRTGELLTGRHAINGG